MKDDVRGEMVALLGRIVGNQPLSPDLQRISMEMLAALLPQPNAAGEALSSHAPAKSAAGEATLLGTAPTAMGNRRLVYVHGICRHGRSFSDSWWGALRPFISMAFGTGQLGQTRLEVIWSDLVNQASATLSAALADTSDLAAAAGPQFDATPAVLAAETLRRQAAEEIKEALRDRADQHVMGIALRTDGLAAEPQAAADTSGLISIPGLNCIDDFSIYLTNDEVRQQIIDRFLNVVRPELQAGRELDIIGHSWGTVVAYEGLRQLEDEGLHSPFIRNLFTVGSALSIGPVKIRLRLANKDGKKPAGVRRWVNLDAYGDLVGGPLKGRPYAVDFDYVNLDAFGCGTFLGLVNPQCAHSSYFAAGNVAVNREIFARYIDLL